MQLQECCQVVSWYSLGVHPTRLGITKPNRETIMDTDRVAVRDAIVGGKCTDRRAKTAVHLVGYHDVGSVRK